VVTGWNVPESVNRDQKLHKIGVKNLSPIEFKHTFTSDNINQSYIYIYTVSKRLDFCLLHFRI